MTKFWIENFGSICFCFIRFVVCFLILLERFVISFFSYKIIRILFTFTGLILILSFLVNVCWLYLLMLKFFVRRVLGVCKVLTETKGDGFPTSFGWIFPRYTFKFF